MKVRDHLDAASRKLESAPLDGTNPRLEAEVLLSFALDAPRSFLYAHGELEVPPRQGRAFQGLVKRRAHGEPVAYITGSREFWSLPLHITPDVLIPRHETERLIEAALEWADRKRPIRIADIGTGSGAIALALASERPAAEIHATDISPAAIEVARDNAGRLGFGAVRFHVGSWLEPLSGEFDLVVSNPPYVASTDPHLQQGDPRFEPRHALTPGGDGLAAIREIARQAVTRLKPGGGLLLEHGQDQGPSVRAILLDNSLVGVETLPDLEGRDRVSRGRRRR